MLDQYRVDRGQIIKDKDDSGSEIGQQVGPKKGNESKTHGKG